MLARGWIFVPPSAAPTGAVLRTAGRTRAVSIRQWATRRVVGWPVRAEAMAAEGRTRRDQLRRLGLVERVGPVFAREQIDENALPFLTVEDLVEAGVADEDARKVVSAAAVPDAEPAAEPEDAAAEEPATAAEEDTPAPESKQIPERLCCPISLELMVRPVIAADGHTYDRSSIEDWLARGNTTSPTTGAKLEHLHLADNHLVRSMVSEYQDSLASR